MVRSDTTTPTDENSDADFDLARSRCVRITAHRRGVGVDESTTVVDWMEMKRERLDDRDARADLVSRVARLTPESARHWGRMTSHQAVCHLRDSFRAVM